MAKHGKRYRDAYKSVDRERQYAPREAIQLIKELNTTKFDETVEVGFDQVKKI